LKERDILIDGRQSFEIVFTYNFKVSDACEVSPRFPVFNQYLYESVYDSQFWMIFNSNKKLMGSGFLSFLAGFFEL